MEIVYKKIGELKPYENNPRKNDGADERWYSVKLNGFYQSPEWVKCRKVYIQSTKGLCERCLGLGIYNAGKIVHHKIPLTESNYQDAAISLNPDNLMLLCHACHEEIHKGKDRFVWTGDGKLVNIPPLSAKITNPS